MGEGNREIPLEGFESILKREGQRAAVTLAGGSPVHAYAPLPLVGLMIDIFPATAQPHIEIDRAFITQIRVAVNLHHRSGQHREVLIGGAF